MKPRLHPYILYKSNLNCISFALSLFITSEYNTLPLPSDLAARADFVGNAAGQLDVRSLPWKAWISALQKKKKGAPRSEGQPSVMAWIYRIYLGRWSVPLGFVRGAMLFSAKTGQLSGTVEDRIALCNSVSCSSSVETPEPTGLSTPGQADRG
jgi:hypothetical protein